MYFLRRVFGQIHLIVISFLRNCILLNMFHRTFTPVIITVALFVFLFSANQGQLINWRFNNILNNHTAVKDTDMNAIDTFWRWFKTNNKSFLTLNDKDISDKEKERRLDDMMVHLHAYCDHLYFEMGGMPGEQQELIITAEGDKNYFDMVDNLIKKAPVIDNWKFTAFMQSRPLDYTSNYEDVELKPLKMWFLPLDSKSKPDLIGLRVCIPNYDSVKDSKWLQAAVYKVLDGALGEKIFALDINYVEIGNLPEDPEKQGMIELKDLSKFVAWKKRKINSQ